MTDDTNLIFGYALWLFVFLGIFIPGMMVLYMDKVPMFQKIFDFIAPD